MNYCLWKQKMTINNKRPLEDGDFRVPRKDVLYHLDADFGDFTTGSLFTINYPSGKRYGSLFSMRVLKKDNKDSPAKTFGCRYFVMLELNQLKATQLKTVYNNLSEEQLAQVNSISH